MPDQPFDAAQALTDAAMQAVAHQADQERDAFARSLAGELTDAARIAAGRAPDPSVAPSQAVRRAAVLHRLRELDEGSWATVDGISPHAAHEEADHLLLAYIDDDAIRDAFLEILRWYG